LNYYNINSENNPPPVKNKCSSRWLRKIETTVWDIAWSTYTEGTNTSGTGVYDVRETKVARRANNNLQKSTTQSLGRSGDGDSFDLANAASATITNLVWGVQINTDTSYHVHIEFTANGNANFVGDRYINLDTEYSIPSLLVDLRLLWDAVRQEDYSWKTDPNPSQNLLDIWVTFKDPQYVFDPLPPRLDVFSNDEPNKPKIIQWAEPLDEQPSPPRAEVEYNILAWTAACAFNDQGFNDIPPDTRAGDFYDNHDVWDDWWDALFMFAKFDVTCVTLAKSYVRFKGIYHDAKWTKPFPLDDSKVPSCNADWWEEVDVDHDQLSFATVLIEPLFDQGNVRRIIPFT
jgi:hypothetical protein